MTGRARRATRPTSCLFGAAWERTPRRCRRWGFGSLPFGSCGEEPTGKTHEVGQSSHRVLAYAAERQPVLTDSSADARDPMTSLARRAAVSRQAGIKQGAQSLCDCAQRNLAVIKAWQYGNAIMKAKALEEVMQRVESWSESAQEELTEIAKEIEVGI